MRPRSGWAYSGDVPWRVALLGHHFVAGRLTPPRRLPMAFSGPTPPRRPPMPPPDDVVYVQDGYFIAAWRLAPPR
uniref:Uncharacterized protein n=1 Tax=Oryza rufipogon TaxID=4529 RepID=A0A0E0R9X3_ORYRU